MVGGAGETTTTRLCLWTPGGKGVRRKGEDWLQRWRAAGGTEREEEVLRDVLRLVLGNFACAVGVGFRLAVGAGT